MKSAKELKTFLQGSDITAEQYSGMVDLVGEEEADSYVISKQPKSPTVGFANFFTVMVKDRITNKMVSIQKINFKLALRETNMDSLKAQAIDGWIFLTGVMNPNSSGNGYHVAEDFVETFQDANSRKEASKNDNGFRLKPYLPMSSNNSDAPQDANSSNVAF